MSDGKRRSTPVRLPSARAGDPAYALDIELDGLVDLLFPEVVATQV